jgi:hypothetical protein
MKYLQHERLAAVNSESLAISEFLEWLEAEGISLSRPDPKVTRDGCWHLPITERHDSLLARFFGIDPVALENERRAMLADMRASAKTPTS